MGTTSTPMSPLPCYFPLDFWLALLCLILLLFLNEIQIQLTSLPGTTSSAAFERCLGELSN